MESFPNEIVQMTPEKARCILEKNHQNNRPIKRTLVDFLARQMIAGEWKRSPQGISLAKDGTLLDGQHRLLAVVQSGVAVPMTVFPDVDGDLLINFDTGVPRNVRDIIRLAFSEKVSTKQIACINFLYNGLYENGKRHYVKIQASKVYEALKRLALSMDAVLSALRSHNKTGGVAASPVYAAIVRAHQYCLEREEYDPQKVLYFYNVLLSGVTQTEQDLIIIRHRDFLMKPGNSQHAWGNRMLAYNRTERVLKLWLNRENPTRVYPSEEELFPIALDKMMKCSLTTIDPTEEEKL